MRKYLITGGAGFIGSHLADRLVIEGAEVVILDNLLLGTLGNIKHLIDRNQVRFIEEDLLNFDQVRFIMNEEKFDRVYHLAANSDIAQGINQTDLDFNLNLQTTRSVLEGMSASKTKELMFASTSAIYGETDHEISEDFGPLFPVSFYGASKLAAEAYISVYAYNHGMKVWIARFPNVVGERATHGAIFDLIKKLEANPKKLEVLGDGSQCKPYLYVKELADAIQYFINKGKDSFNYINIGVESRTYVRDIVRIVIEEMGHKPNIEYTGGDRGWVGDVPNFRYSIKKMNRLGWKAKLLSDESVRKAVQEILNSRKKQ